MKRLFATFGVFLASTSAFSNQTGNTNVAVFDIAKVAAVDVTGSAAASLYELLNAREVSSKAYPGAMLKTGSQIACYKSFATVGEMISPVVPIYHCAFIVSADGSIEGDSEVSSDNPVKIENK